MKSIKILCTFAILANFNVYAETNETVNKNVKFKADEDGGYESSAVTEITTDEGTTETISTKEKVDVDSEGNVKGTLKTDTRVNPSGVMNETWKKEEATNQIKADGSSKLEAHAKELSPDGTLTDTKLKTVSKVKDNGLTETTSKLKTTVDPKGMLNKSVIETNKTIIKNTDGTTTVESEKIVDGEVVEKK